MRLNIDRLLSRGNPSLSAVSLCNVRTRHPSSARAIEAELGAEQTRLKRQREMDRRFRELRQSNALQTVIMN